MTLARVSQRLERVRLDSLRPHPRNAKEHAGGLIKESFEATGWYGAIYVQASTRYILAGHGRCEELRGLGEEEVDAFLMDVDDATALKILLSQRIQEAAGYDKDLLAELLIDLDANDDLLGTGFTAFDVESLLEGQQADEVIIEPPEFQGGYAEAPTATTNRMRAATPNKMAGLREKVLVYPEDDFHRLQDAINAVNAFHATSSDSDAILVGMRAYARQLATDQERIDEGAE